MYHEYDMVPCLVIPTESKPVVRYPYNEHDVAGSVDSIRAEWIGNGWRNEVCGAKAVYIDMGLWYYAISGWKRSKAHARLKREMPADWPKLVEFTGFETLVFHKSLAWDPDTCRFLIKLMNSTNKLALGAFIVDRLLAVKDPRICCN